MGNRGMITVEILLAFFLWAIFLTGIVSLWFGLFGSNTPLWRYIEREQFFVNFLNNKITSNGTYIDRGISLVTGSGGLQGISADWKNAFGKKSCRGFYAQKLKQVVSEPLLLDSLNIASSAVVRGSYMYITTNSGSTTIPDLYVVDIKNSLQPKVVSGINTGPGLSSLNVSGYMIFASNTSINSQAQGIDITNPNLPAVTWSFKVPGSQGTSTALGRAVVSDGKFVYLGTVKNESAELFSINAKTGQLVSSYEMFSGVNGLYLNNGLLYVSSPVDPELQVFSTDEGNLSFIKSYDAPGGSGNGKALEIINEHVFLGRTLGGNELVLLDEDLNKIDDAKIGATVDSLIASKDVIYVLTGHSQKELQVWKESEGSLELLQSIDLPTRGVSIGCSQGYLFVVIGTSSPLLIFEPENI